MIVFDHDGESVVVNPDTGRGIPTESVSADVISKRVEAEEMASREIIIIERSKNYGSIWQHGGGGRSLVSNRAGTQLVGCRIDSNGGAEETGVRLVGDTLGGDGQKDAATIGQAILKRGLPLGREVSGVHGEQVAGEIVEMRAADGVNRRAVGRNCRRDVDSRALRTARGREKRSDSRGAWRPGERGLRRLVKKSS